MANANYLKKLIRQNLPKTNIKGKAPSTNTLKQHLKHSQKFGEWVKAHYKCRTFESCGTKAVDKRSDAQRDVSPRLFDFAKMVDIRRHEYLALRQDDLMRDESGSLCAYTFQPYSSSRALIVWGVTMRKS